jgi:phosphotransferase system HPr (HPr) family protein
MTRIITLPLPAEAGTPAPETAALGLVQKNTDAMSGNSLQQRVRLANIQGLHMRPIRLFVEAANRFHSAISVSFGDKRVNGNSAIEMMFLAAGNGDELLLEATGPDAAEALNALVEVVNRFVEEDQEPPPTG